MQAEESVYEDFPVSTGLLQAIEDLGRITRREAEIEYAPTWATRDPQTPRPRFIVNNALVSTATHLRTWRQSPTTVLDSLEGVLTALDVQKGTLRIRISAKRTVRGTFEALAQDRLIRSLNKRVRLHGVVESVNGRPRFIRTFFVDVPEDE